MSDSSLVKRSTLTLSVLCCCVNLATAALSETASQSASYKVIIADLHAAPEPHTPQPEAGQVVAVLEKLITAMADGDMKSYADLLSDDCTLYDEEKGKALTGKAEVSSAVRKQFQQATSTANDGVRELVIEHPYVKVSGDMAVVTFKLAKKQGESTSRQLYTNIFTRDHDTWKKSYDRGNWNLQ